MPGLVVLARAKKVTLDEVRSFAASTSLEGALHQLVYGPAQKGAPRGSLQKPVVIGWAARTGCVSLVNPRKQ
ncbi:MAG: hypothetical protein H0V83_09495 [Rubrobacter sp.]|nr:hypothetical protein [Rubrobacter sp.]